MPPLTSATLPSLVPPCPRPRTTAAALRDPERGEGAKVCIEV